MTRALAFVVAANAVSCAYRVVGSDAPFGASRIAVLTFSELAPIGVAPDLSQELSLLLAHGGARLVADRSAADAVLTGRVIAARTAPVPIADPRGAISAYQISLNVEARLESARGEALWSTVVSLDEDFLPDDGQGAPTTARTLGTEAQRRSALDRLARRAALEIYDRLMVGAHTANLQPTS